MRRELSWLSCSQQLLHIRISLVLTNNILPDREPLCLQHAVDKLTIDCNLKASVATIRTTTFSPRMSSLGDLD